MHIELALSKKQNKFKPLAGLMRFYLRVKSKSLMKICIIFLLKCHCDGKIIEKYLTFYFFVVVPMHFKLALL